ncbi:MAG TPA: HIT domain-containing protein [Candidatus Paceibacterota bacterium]|nr:HIT domain-containing protein [Candidatus Pacearchaeota archaeon]HRZ51401.1 HIT domain-containing protein [Candidatus Paceibacterota bacterium]HSA37123.1 HIT domain-containing protein [Candidatus Paceibacterota bacterium]
MDNCVFCKIVKGEIPAARIWEDDKFLAILDVSPNTKGMALVMPKAHYDSYAFDMEGDIYAEFFSAAKKVSKILEKGLGVIRVALVMEGMGVNHAHLKLYPLYGLEEKFHEMWPKDRVFFENYEGYISTQLGPQADLAELKKLAEDIKKKNGLE